MGPEAYVLDATPIISGYTPSLTGALHFTTNEVLEELNDTTRFRLALNRGWLEVREPSKTSLERTMKTASQTGDRNVLSEADLSILALSLDLQEEGNKITLLTDDYSVQNVATKLGLRPRRYLWRGIKRTIQWIQYCPRCGKTYKTSIRVCLNCGSTLKRKAEKNVKP